MMLTPITIDELYVYIKIAFDGDTELPVYHISDSKFAWHTYEEIIKTAKILPLTYYKVGDFGFTVTSPGLLYSFGINVAHRDKETLQKWFAEIKDILITFDCALHGKNSRAILHLVKQGMRIKEHMTILTFNN